VSSTGRVAGKVALITGGARGLGRAHAVRLAEEGADVVVLDLCRDVASSPYAMGHDEDMAETVRLVEAAGRRVIARQADVRDQKALDDAVAETLKTFGRLDIVVPNAGLVSFGKLWELTEEQWTTAIDVLLTGVWHTVKATVPSMITAGNGGSVVILGSAVGTKASPNIGHYVTAKHGLVGLMRSLALEVAEHSIRVNLIAPGSVETPLAASDVIFQRMRPDLDSPTIEDVDERLRANHALPVRWVQPSDVSNAVLWLASDEARYITGAVLPVDAGWVIK
jgi:SDR family mycofactocin-dependent oxidoreductase